MRHRTLLLVAALSLALTTPAAQATSVNVDVDSVNITTSNPASGVAGTLSVDPKGAGTADDELIVFASDLVSGCSAAGPIPGSRRCVLGAVRVITWAMNSGSATDNTFTADIDRPGLDMRATFSKTGGLLSLDGSATSDGTLIVSGAASVKGGGGDDAISGTGGPDLLEGGGGDDAISGLGGNDTLRGGGGSDTLSPGAGGPGAETADGGPGTQDTISVADQNLPYALSLDGATNDGAAGRPLTLIGIENLTGGFGADSLVGDAGFNHLYGLGGADTLDGAGGGHDVLRGGNGADTLLARDANPLFGDLGCGGGPDTAIVDVLDVVDPDCESVDRAPAPPGFVPPGTPGAAGTSGDTTAPVTTISGAPSRISRAKLRKGVGFSVRVSESSTVVAELVVTARRVASAAALTDNLVVARSTTRKVTGTRRLRLKPAAALLARAKRVALRVTATDAAGNRRTVTKRIVVR